VPGDKGILKLFILSGNSPDRVMPVLSLSITCPPAFSREKQKRDTGINNAG